jgi:hypothetical protein
MNCYSLPVLPDAGVSLTGRPVWDKVFLVKESSAFWDFSFAFSASSATLKELFSPFATSFNSLPTSVSAFLDTLSISNNPFLKARIFSLSAWLYGALCPETEVEEPCSSFLSGEQPEIAKDSTATKTAILRIIVISSRF